MVNRRGDYESALKYCVIRTGSKDMTENVKKTKKNRRPLKQNYYTLLHPHPL